MINSGWPLPLSRRPVSRISGRQLTRMLLPLALLLLLLLLQLLLQLSLLLLLDLQHERST